MSNNTQFNQTILRNNRDAEFYLERARNWIRLKEYGRAIFALNQAIEIEPKKPLLYYGRGLVYIAQNNYIKAISDLNEAIQLAPNYSLAYYNRALTYYSVGQYKRARKDYQKVIQLESKENLAKYYNSPILVELLAKKNQHSPKEIGVLEREKPDKNNKNARHQQKYRLKNYYLLAFLATSILGVFISFINSFVFKKNLDFTQLAEEIELTPKSPENLEINLQPRKIETFLIPSDQVKSTIEVNDAPKGSFHYGGSIAWALIRTKVDPLILAQTPEFSLKYREHPILVPSSGVGIKMLLDNQLTIAHSSRPLHSQEYQLAKQRNFTLKQIPIAIDGVAIVTNPSLDIPGLTLAQLKDVYRGKILNWKQLGGPDLEIMPYSQPPHSSGTAEFFADRVMNKENLGSRVSLVNSVTQGVKYTAKHKGAIFYASAPEIIGQCSVKPIPIGRDTDNLIPPYVEPLVTPQQCPFLRNQINRQIFQQAQYPLTHHLFVIIKQNGEIEEKVGNAYTKMLLSSRGQKLISEAGYLPIPKIK